MCRINLCSCRRAAVVAGNSNSRNLHEANQRSHDSAGIQMLLSMTTTMRMGALQPLKSAGQQDSPPDPANKMDLGDLELYACR